MNYFSLAYFQEKWAHAGFQKYLRNTSWLFLSRIVSMVISFFVGAYIARYLGPQNYGSLNYIVSFVGLFSFIAGMGIDSILVRDLVKYPEKRDELLGTGFVHLQEFLYFYSR
jgi:O-antigen/teichoic acid export membrane protein